MEIDSTDPTQERRLLEQELVDAILAAKEEYHVIVNRYNEMMAIAQDIGLQISDGSMAMRVAIELRRKSFNRYVTSIRALSDFVLEEWPHSCFSTSRTGDD
jgi:hypothetical protein